MRRHMFKGDSLFLLILLEVVGDYNNANLVYENAHLHLNHFDPLPGFKGYRIPTIGSMYE